MTEGIRKRVSVVAAAVLLLSSPLIAPAQSASASYQVPRQSIDGGAGRSASANYTVNGTIGQPDAGATMTSASYRVRGGFHPAAESEAPPDPLFSNGFETP